MTSPSLAELRDIHLPPPPLLASVFPEWWMMVGLLALLAIGGWWSWRFLHRRRLRGALRELARLAAAHARDGDTTRLTGGLSRLLRQYALASFPRAGVAGLTGADWLAFLDRQGGKGEFSSGVGVALASRPYRHHGEVDEAALIALIRRWLLANPR